MIGRRVREDQPQKLPQGQRIRRAPCDRALRVQSFEVADQQQPEVASRRQRRASNLVGVEPLTQVLDVLVELRGVENLIQSRIKGMRGAPRQVLGRHPHRRLLRPPFAFTHRHRVRVYALRSFLANDLWQTY